MAGICNPTETRLSEPPEGQDFMLCGSLHQMKGQADSCRLAGISQQETLKHLDCVIKKALQNPLYHRKKQKEIKKPQQKVLLSLILK
jgi:hypothetical protein